MLRCALGYPSISFISSTPSKALRNWVKKGLRRYYSTQSLGIRQRPILPGRFQPSTFSAERLNFCVRYGYRWCPPAIVTGNFPGGAFSLPVRFALRFRVAHSPLSSLPLPAPSKLHRSELTSKLTLSFVFLRSSPRPISIGKLHASQRFHRRPIYLIVSEGSYLL